MHGWVVEATSLDSVAFPPELAEEPVGGVAIAVSHYRPRGAPWSRLIIFIVATSGGGVRAENDVHRVFVRLDRVPVTNLH